MITRNRAEKNCLGHLFAKSSRCSTIHLAGWLFAMSAWFCCGFCQRDTIIVTAPVQGHIYYMGDSMTIAWTVPESTSLTGLVIEISPNRGHTVTDIKSISRLRRSFTWAVDTSVLYSVDAQTKINLISDACYVRVRDYENHNLGGVSSFFAIARRNAESITPKMRQQQKQASPHASMELTLGINWRQKVSSGIFQLNGRTVQELKTMEFMHSGAFVGTGLLVIKKQPPVQ
jgi:hypothetical protein